jgi:hypothetical protein
MACSRQLARLLAEANQSMALTDYAHRQLSSNVD